MTSLVSERAAPVAPSPAAPTATLRLTDIVKRFRRASGQEFYAVDHVSLEVSQGEFVVLLGPSGCGKTTLLRCVAGLETPDTGTIETPHATLFSSAERIDRPTEHRGLSMIFQSYALWPHMTVFQNVAYPLRARRVRKAEIARRVEEVLTLVGIPELQKQYPSQMSGGQQQRVALARALVSNDEMILFDEPLSNVDAKVREQLRSELIAMQQELGFAALYVTHDQMEAMSMADRIAVMSHGRVAQLDTPSEIYERPRTRYVANFVGVNNEIAARFLNHAGHDECEVETSMGTAVGTPGATSLQPDDDVIVVCRPEKCQLWLEPPASANCWTGSIVRSVYFGSHAEHVVQVGSQQLRVWRHDAVLLEPGTDVWITAESVHLRVLPLEQ